MSTKHLNIEKRIISLKYILLYAGQTWLAYFTVYLNDKGFNDKQIASLYGAFQATMFFIVAVWGLLSDRYGVRKIYLILSVISSILLFNLTSINNFYPLFFYVIFLSIFLLPCAPALESISIYYIHQSSKSSFGALRMYGAVGWGIASPLLGIAIDKYYPDLIFKYAALMIFLTSILAFVLLKMDKHKIKGAKINFHELKHFFKGSFMVFMLILFLFGFALAPISHVISLYYQSIGANSTILGFSFTIQTIFEIPFFFFGALVVKKIGAPRAIVISIFVAIIRLVLYGMITNPYLALPVGALQGFTLSLFITGVVEYIQEGVLPTLRSTAQSLIWAFHFGAGYTLGSFWLSYLSNYYSMNEVMFVQAGITFLVFVLTVIYFKSYPLEISKDRTK